jgi:hypothetical protein
MSELKSNEIHLTDSPTNFITNIKDLSHYEGFFEESKYSMSELFSQNEDFSDKKLFSNLKSNYRRPSFKIVNKKRGRCYKLRNKHAIHTKYSFDNSYKKIINKSIKNLVSELNQLIENKFGKDYPNLNIITGIEKGYVKSLLEKTIEKILIDYRQVKKKQKETKENKDIIEEIKNDKEIKEILDCKFHCYIDTEMKKKIMKEISDEEEITIWETILEKGILEFCKSKKSKKKKNKKIKI